jgi:pyruvate/2-oxoglutarate/acetoin dehydrogenase E1 component
MNWTETIMRKTTFIQAINEAMKDEMRRDPSVYVMGEDVGYYGGLFRVTRNLMDEFGPNRVIDTPISEQGFVGMAIGSAMVGLRPIIELMYMDFFMVCADQIFNQAAKMHYMTGGLLNVPMVIRGQHGRRQTLWIAAQPGGGELVCPVPRHQGGGAFHAL